MPGSVQVHPPVGRHAAARPRRRLIRGVGLWRGELRPRRRPVSAVKSQNQFSPGSKLRTDRVPGRRRRAPRACRLGRGVAAADVPALRTAAQVEPPAAGVLALHAPVPLGRRGGVDTWAPGLLTSATTESRENGMETGIYGTDGTDPEEASGLLEPEEPWRTSTACATSSTRAGAAGGPWAVDDWGTTEAEEAAGESLDGRLARELPDDPADEGDGLGDSTDTDGELLDDEVGDVRAGRLVDAERDDDTDDELSGRHQGIDGAAASAEEAAVHIVASRLRFASAGSDCVRLRSRIGKPVLLSVDDDPGVSRAVARDLRRRYGEDLRVLRAASGAEALEALRELKLRGDGGGVARRLPDAADERHRVPGAGHGPVPSGSARAAHRLRRYRGRDPRRSTWSTSISTCSSPGTRRTRSSIRSSTR